CPWSRSVLFRFVVLADTDASAVEPARQSRCAVPARDRIVRVQRMLTSPAGDSRLAIAVFACRARFHVGLRHVGLSLSTADPNVHARRAGKNLELSPISGIVSRMRQMP